MCLERCWSCQWRWCDHHMCLVHSLVNQDHHEQQRIGDERQTVKKNKVMMNGDKKLWNATKKWWKATTYVKYTGFIHKGNKESCCLRSWTFSSWKIMIEMLGGNPFPSDVSSGTQPVNHMVIKPREACASKYCHCLIGKSLIVAVFLPLDCRQVLASTRKYWQVLSSLSNLSKCDHESVKWNRQLHPLPKLSFWVEI